MNVFKVIRIALVFCASAIVVYAGTIQIMLWIFVAWLPHKGKFDDGNGGALFFIAGALLGIVVAPTVGALAALGVEGIVRNWSRKHSSAG